MGQVWSWMRGGGGDGGSATSPTDFNTGDAFVNHPAEKSPETPVAETQPTSMMTSNVICFVGRDESRQVKVDAACEKIVFGGIEFADGIIVTPQPDDKLLSDRGIAVVQALDQKWLSNQADSKTVSPRCVLLDATASGFGSWDADVLKEMVTNAKYEQLWFFVVVDYLPVLPLWLRNQVDEFVLFRGATSVEMDKIRNAGVRLSEQELCAHLCEESPITICMSSERRAN
jgi:hypothetical protein